MSRINNTFDLTGFVGNDPEKRFNTTNGNPILTVSLAVDDSYKDRETGEIVNRTDWFELTIYREGLVDIFEKYVRKGSEIHVRGNLRKQKWESKDRVDEEGSPRIETRIQLIVTSVRLGRRPKDGTSNGGGMDNKELDQGNMQSQVAGSSLDDDNDIPY